MQPDNVAIVMISIVILTNNVFFICNTPFHVTGYPAINSSCHGWVISQSFLRVRVTPVRIATPISMTTAIIT